MSTLRVAKAGSTLEECEDAFGVVPASKLDEWLTGPVLVAVADGASESLLARDWAGLLTQAILDQAAHDVHLLRDSDEFARAMINAGNRWAGWLAAYIARREARGQPIAWYEQPKMDRGAYATVIAAHFESDATSTVRWHAAAIGDSCLFQVRDDRMIRAFPMDIADDFANTTTLVNSNIQDHGLLASHVRLVDGVADQGDDFFLCTDALAAWFLREVEAAGRPWQVLRNFTAVGDNDGLAEWLDDQRRQGKLRNDDVVIVHVDLG